MSLLNLKEISTINVGILIELKMIKVPTFLFPVLLLFSGFGARAQQEDDFDGAYILQMFNCGPVLKSHLSAMSGTGVSGSRSLLLDIPALPLATPVSLQRFGDDVYKYVGCAAGMYQNVTAYEQSLGMDTTANFLGESQRFDGDRISIQYFDFGNKDSGKAMILLAGLGSLMRSWSPILLQGLAVNNRILIMDYPGQGQPPRKSEGIGSFLYNQTSDPLPLYSIDFMANSAYQLLEYLGLNNTNTSVMGRSMGSIVALQMGVLHGDSLGKIIAVSNVVLNTDAKSADLLQNAQSNVDETKVYYPIDYQEGGCAIAQWLCYKLEAQQVYEGLMSWTANSNTTMYQRIALDDFINNGMVEGFRTIKNPVMAIQGELDNTAPVKNLVRASMNHNVSSHSPQICA